ncbi:multicopper oxidase [Phanerochaete sordida]|uniref:laccase n=1 Tax=Phanerochaete sordida TaxID=48140 RepID=A0A9P3GK88_9APHY|nr:multicopper oxidase [Phanerochaete sordida]
MRYNALYFPLVFVIAILALVTRSEACTVPHDTASASKNVTLPPADNFVVGSIIGQRPTTRYFDFVISEMTGAPDGSTKPMLVANGMFPGPTIEANQGDRIVVKVTNHLPNRTSIHWHGLPQNGTNFYDGTTAITECGIPPGQSLTYDFSVATFSGTTWWHAPHTQYTDGVLGALIVHPRTYPHNFPTWDEDLVVIVSDVYHTFSSIIAAQYIGGGPGVNPLNLEVPDSGAINGIGQFNASAKYTNFHLKPNKTYRLRLIHTGSSAEITFSLDFHALTVIEADTTLVEPYKVQNLTLAVAQRYSVLITTNEHAEPAGNYWMRTELQSLVPVNGTNSDVRAIVRYGDSSALPTTKANPGVPGAALPALDEAKLAPAVPKTPPMPTKFYSVNFTLALTSSGGVISAMNGTSWSPLASGATLLDVVDAAKNGSAFAPEGSSVELGNQFMITEDSIEVVDLLVINTGPGDHPFHLHGHTPYIIGSGTGNYTGTGLNTVNPMLRDTFIAPSTGWVLIRFITDNPGVWALHCHIAWHMLTGLLMQINSLPSKAAELCIPQDVLNQCSA